MLHFPGCFERLRANETGHPARSNGRLEENDITPWQRKSKIEQQIYGNEFRSVGYGAIKLLLRDQGDICGNSCEGGGCDLRG